MNLENIKSTTTWAEASGTMNNNNAKITEAIERLESAVEEGGSGGTADSVAWNKVTGKPSWITDSKPVYAKEDLSQGVQTSLDKADTALQAIPDGYATEEYTQTQVRHILTLISTALEGKVDKVDGKQLSTEDFTTALKEKLEAISSSGGGGVDSEALQALSDRLDLIVSGGTSGVIDSFIDMISFLTGINDSVKLKDMLDTLRESILRKQNTIEDLDAIRSGAALGATAVQQDALSGYLPLTGGNIEGDVRIMNQSGVLILVNTANGERAAFSYRGESGWYVSNNNWAVDYKLWHEGNFNPLTYKAPSAANADNADTLDGMHGYSYFRSLGGFGDNTDFNNVIESGVYINTVGNYTNYQNEPFSHGYLLVFNTGNGYAKSLQIATPHSGSEIKVRQFWADSWTPWKSLAFTDGNVASADNATTAQLSDKSILLQGVESDDFSGTDLELNMKLFSGVSAGAEGLFPYGSNANAVLTVNKHRGNYNSQLGFSSNGLLYYRNGSNEVLTTQPWRRIMFEGDNINILRGVDGKILINSGNGFASIGDGYFNDGDILYINGKSIAMRSSDSTDLAINPSGDVDVTKNLKVAKNLTVNGAIVTTSDVGTTIVYPWGVDIKAELPSVNFFFGKGESITTRLIEHYAGSLFCEGTFIATKGLQSATSITSGGDITSGGHITSNGHVYIPNNQGVALFDTNGVPHRSLMISQFNDLVIGHDTASASLPTFIDGNAIYFRYSNGHYTGMALNASGNVGIGTTEPIYKLEVVSGIGNVAMIESTSTSLEASILYKGSDGKSWAVGKGTGAAGDSFGFWSLTKSANVLMMRADGCVGIGTNDPRNELDILNNGEGLRLLSRNDKSVMLIQNVGGMNWEVGAMNNNIFAIRSTVWGGNVIVCNHSGDVGIGTSTLSARLNVGGSANVTENISVGGNASIGGTALISGHSLRCRVLRDGANQWIIGKLDDENGAIGIGSVNLTQPIKLENLNGNAVLGSDGKFSISGDVSIGGTSTLRDVRMSDALAVRMGVGTTISEDYALSVGGDVSVSGYVMTEGVSMYSQRSLKDVVDEEGLSLEELATIKPTRFTWKDGRDGRVHIGGIADDVQKVLPEAVRETPEGILTMDYPVASFAVASSLVKPVTNHEERIAELERENKQLREELEMIKRYIGYGNDK